MLRGWRLGLPGLEGRQTVEAAVVVVPEKMSLEKVAGGEQPRAVVEVALAELVPPTEVEGVVPVLQRAAAAALAFLEWRVAGSAWRRMVCARPVGGAASCRWGEVVPSCRWAAAAVTVFRVCWVPRRPAAWARSWWAAWVRRRTCRSTLGRRGMKRNQKHPCRRRRGSSAASACRLRRARPVVVRRPCLRLSSHVRSGRCCFWRGFQEQGGRVLREVWACHPFPYQELEVRRR